MTGFAADWLDLREAADAAARASALLDEVRARAPAAIVDLATGTGANLRYLAPRLGGEQQWRLVDHDPALLDALPARMTAWAAAHDFALTAHADGGRIAGATFACEFHASRFDLRGIDALPLEPETLVTASALLDLVSARWIDALARRLAETRSSGLFALTYDGRADLVPADPDDAWIVARVNAHQRTDKGFGAALGPAAAEYAAQALRAQGFSVVAAPSDWRIGSRESALQVELLRGWAEAALESAPGDADRCTAWLTRRLDLAAAGTLTVRVGHVDIAAGPPSCV
jgi:hypothetical protein